MVICLPASRKGKTTKCLGLSETLYVCFICLVFHLLLKIIKPFLFPSPLRKSSAWNLCVWEIFVAVLEEWEWCKNLQHSFSFYFSPTLGSWWDCLDLPQLSPRCLHGTQSKNYVERYHAEFWGFLDNLFFLLSCKPPAIKPSNLNLSKCTFHCFFSWDLSFPPLSIITDFFVVVVVHIV